MKGITFLSVSDADNGKPREVARVDAAPDDSASVGARMMKYPVNVVWAARKVLRARLRYWDAERALEKVLGRELLAEDDDAISQLCAALGNAKDVSDDDARRLLETIEP